VSTRLKRRKTQRRWPESSLARVEMDIMNAAYAMRKLVEARTKVPLSVRDQEIDVVKYPRTSAEGDPDAMNWHHIEHWYDFEAGVADHLSVIDLCNQVIHSWIFVTAHEDEGKGGLSGILVSSDRKRKTTLYHVALDDLLAVLRSFAEKDVASLRMERDNSGQWRVIEALSRDELPDGTGHDQPGGGTMVAIKPIER
jgi:hypothetical protein